MWNWRYILLIRQHIPRWFNSILLDMVQSCNRPILQGQLRQFPSISEWSIIADLLKTTQHLWLTKLITVLFQTVSSMSFIIPGLALFPVFRPFMILLLVKKYLCGMDMIWITALNGTWRLGLKVCVSKFEYSNSSGYFIGNFAIPESMKREYGEC